MLKLPFSVIVLSVCEILPFEFIVILPEIDISSDIVKVVVTLAPIVKDLADDVAVKVGCFDPVKFASPSTASIVDEGMPFVQLAEVLQFVLEVPFQLVVVCAIAFDKFIAKINSNSL